MESCPQALSGSANPSLANTAIASSPHKPQAIRTRRLVKPPEIMPNRAVFSFVAEPPAAMLCISPRIWTRLAKVIAAMEYHVYSLVAIVPNRRNLNAGTILCRPAKPPTAFSPSGINRTDMTIMRSP